jgi:hypothetical protein
MAPTPTTFHLSSPHDDDHPVTGDCRDVLGRIERPAEDAGDERGGQCLAVEGFGGVAAVVHRVQPVTPAGVQADDRQPVESGERPVLAFRVEDGDHPLGAVDGQFPAEERLDERGLA